MEEFIIHRRSGTITLYNSNNLTSVIFTHIQKDKHYMSENDRSATSLQNQTEPTSLHISIANISTELNGLNYCYNSIQYFQTLK